VPRFFKSVPYWELPPSAALRPWVQCFWVARTPAALLAQSGPQRVLPDGCMDIILARHGRERDGREAFAVTAVGTMTRFLDAAPLPLRIGVRFRPGMGRLFLRAPAPSLTDAEIPLDELWGEDAERLLAELASCRATATRIRVLERWLLRRLVFAGEHDADVHALVERLVASRGRASVGDLMRPFARSERQLRRRFESVVGVGPKRLARILRFQDVVQRASAAEPRSWAELAAEVGYYDQAHMIGEFRVLAGQTPVEHLASLRA
jgi:AraC-like DNA-binding protein